MNRRAFITTSAGALALGLAGCIVPDDENSGGGDSDTGAGTQVTDAKLTLDDEAMEITCSIQTTTELRYYDEGADEIRYLEPENEMWSMVLLNVTYIGGDQLDPDTLDDAALKIDGKRHEPVEFSEMPIEGRHEIRPEEGVFDSANYRQDVPVLPDSTFRYFPLFDTQSPHGKAVSVMWKYDGEEYELTPQGVFEN